MSVSIDEDDFQWSSKACFNEIDIESSRYMDSVDTPFTEREWMNRIEYYYDWQSNMFRCHKLPNKNTSTGEFMVYGCWASLMLGYKKYKCKEGFKYVDVCYAHEGVFMKVKLENDMIYVLTPPTAIQMLWWDIDDWTCSFPYFKIVDDSEIIEPWSEIIEQFKEINL